MLKNETNIVASKWREIRGSNLWPVKSDTVLPTARHRRNIFSKKAVLPRRNDAEMDPANFLLASAYKYYYIEYHIIAELQQA